jgi:hypothetical protein
VFFESIEVPIAMQQRVVIADAIGRDQDVDCLARSASVVAQHPVIPRCIDPKFTLMKLEHLEHFELVVDQRRLALVTQTLQHFGEDERRQPEALVLEPQVEPFGFWVGDAVDEVDQHAGVDDDHWLLGGAVGAHRVEIALPFHFAAQLAQPALAARLNQQAQPFFNRGALGRGFRIPQRLAHQVVIDVDVGSHDV